MEDRDLTQQAIADAAGVSRTAVVKWLRGTVPGANEVYKLARVYGVNMQYLLGDLPASAEPDSELGMALINAIRKALLESKRHTDHLKSLEDSIRAKSGLPVGNTVANTQSMTMQDLLDRVRRFASEPGKKAELARRLEVPLANVSRWISGQREPSGEATLKLLQWVEEQERKHQ